MAVPLAYLHPPIASDWSSIIRWRDLLRGQGGQPDAQARDAAGHDVIDVQAKRVRVEDLASRRRLRSAQPDEETLENVNTALRASRSYAQSMADFEDEMLRQPFMYEKSRAEGGVVLKSAPMKRGIFVDIEA